MPPQRYESFAIDRIIPETGMMRGVTSDGKVREFCIAIDRDLVTNALSFGVVCHYTDPASEPAFVGSEPWTEEERRGQTG